MGKIDIKIGMILRKIFKYTLLPSRRKNTSPCTEKYTLDINKHLLIIIICFIYHISFVWQCFRLVDTVIESITENKYSDAVCKLQNQSMEESEIKMLGKIVSKTRHSVYVCL